MNVLKLVGRIVCVIFMISAGFSVAKGILHTITLFRGPSPSPYALSPAFAEVGVGLGGLAILLWVFRKLKPVANTRPAQQRA
jgi:hypothetical protein